MGNSRWNHGLLYAECVTPCHVLYGAGTRWRPRNTEHPLHQISAPRHPMRKPGAPSRDATSRRRQLPVGTAGAFQDQSGRQKARAQSEPDGPQTGHPEPFTDHVCNDGRANTTSITRRISGPCPRPPTKPPQLSCHHQKRPVLTLPLRRLRIKGKIPALFSRFFELTIF